MAKCRNCGQQSTPTSDWACPWCGHPLYSARPGEMTYAEVVSRRRLEPVPAKVSADEEEEIDQFEMADMPDISTPDSKILLEDNDRVDTAPEQTAEAGEEGVEQNETRDSYAPPAASPLELKVSELLASYFEDDARADEKFNGRVLKLSGRVVMVGIQDRRDIQIVRLGAEDENAFQTVKCLFGSSHVEELAGLEKGQPVTITGTFRGSLTALNLVDCSFADTAR